MAGILDSKSRVLDTIITTRGKRNIGARGKFEIKYVSFNDKYLFYSTSSEGVLEDQNNRIYFEACSNDIDTIIYEIDPNGSLSPFKTDRYDVIGDRTFPIFDDDGDRIKLVGPAAPKNNLKGSIAMLSASLDIEETPVSNFKRQFILGTREFYKEDLGSTFNVSSQDINFKFDRNSPISGSIKGAPIENIENLFQDFRLGNSDNFKYLPPRAKPNPQFPDGEILGKYKKINQDPLDTIEELKDYLKGKDHRTIDFIETSTSNNILGQIFEFKESGINKLALIDVGEFESDNSNNPHVYFAGKLYRNGRGSLVFVNIFTLVFE